MGSGKCVRCGKPLSDPKSLELGMGPTCFEKWKATFLFHETQKGQIPLDELAKDPKAWVESYLPKTLTPEARESLARVCKVAGVCFKDIVSRYTEGGVTE